MRPRRVGRRPTKRVDTVTERLQLGDECWLDLERQRVVKDGFDIVLSRTEFLLLRAMAERMGQPVGTSELMRVAWGTETGISRTLLYVFIRRLRKRLEDHPNRPTCVVTVHRFGYMLWPRRRGGSGRRHGA